MCQYCIEDICFNQQRGFFFQICDSADTFVSCSFVIHIEMLFIS